MDVGPRERASVVCHYSGANAWKNVGNVPRAPSAMSTAVAIRIGRSAGFLPSPQAVEYRPGRQVRDHGDDRLAREPKRPAIAAVANAPVKTTSTSSRAVRFSGPAPAHSRRRGRRRASPASARSRRCAPSTPSPNLCQSSVCMFERTKSRDATRPPLAQPRRQEGKPRATTWQTCAVKAPDVQSGWPGCGGPMRYGRIISLSSCSTMWQCHTNWPGVLNRAFSRVTWPG
jgi:hypothetical protein